MGLEIKVHESRRFEFENIFRIYLAGTTQSGKTTFCLNILKNELTKKSISELYYYYPSCLDEPPVDWHNELDIPIYYKTGLPNNNDYSSMKRNSLIIIDDQAKEALNSAEIDFLFRVLSGKKEINLAILVQYYFSPGKYTLSIRNCCNYTCLMFNNSQFDTNKKVCNASGLSKAFKAAETENQNKLYPYYLIDRTPTAHVTKRRLYINIFNCIQLFYTDASMKCYIVPAHIFDQFFIVNLEENTLVAKIKNETKKPKIEKSFNVGIEPVGSNKQEKIETNEGVVNPFEFKENENDSPKGGGGGKESSTSSRRKKWRQHRRKLENHLSAR